MYQPWSRAVLKYTGFAQVLDAAGQLVFRGPR
jgi:hypothetical protein